MEEIKIKKILEEQLQLLSEYSKERHPADKLAALTEQMVNLVKLLQSQNQSDGGELSVPCVAALSMSDLRKIEFVRSAQFHQLLKECEELGIRLVPEQPYPDTQNTHSRQQSDRNPLGENRDTAGTL